MKINIKDKTLGFYISSFSALLALIGLIIYFIYLGRGGELDIIAIVTAILGILCPISYLFYQGKLTVIPSVLMPIFLGTSLGLTLGGGVGNIADWFQGVNLFGDETLVPLNFAMAILFGIATIFGVISSFMPLNKEIKQ